MFSTRSICRELSSGSGNQRRLTIVIPLSSCLIWVWTAVSHECVKAFQISKHSKIQCWTWSPTLSIYSFSILWWHNLVLSFLRWKSRNYRWYFLFLPPAINGVFSNVFFRWLQSILVSGVQHSGLTFMYIVIGHHNKSGAIYPPYICYWLHYSSYILYPKESP